MNLYDWKVNLEHENFRLTNNYWTNLVKTRNQLPQIIYDL